MKELSPCPKCFNENVKVEKYCCDTGLYLTSVMYKYIITCPFCGFEMRRNGRKNRKDLIERWNALYVKNRRGSSVGRAPD